MEYSVSEEELDNLFNSPSNDLKDEAIKALKKTSTTTLSDLENERSKPKVKVETPKVEEPPVKKKYQIGVSPRTDLGDSDDFDYRDGGTKETEKETEKEVVKVEVDDIDAILGINTNEFKKSDDDDDAPQDHMDSFMENSIEVEEDVSKEDEVEYEDDTDRVSWDPDEGCKSKEESSEADASDEKDEADGVDDFDFPDGQIDFPEDAAEEVTKEEKVVTKVEEVPVEAVTKEEEYEVEVEVVERLKAEGIVGEDTEEESSSEDEEPSEETDGEESAEEAKERMRLAYDRMPFLEKMRMKIEKSGICKRSSYLDDPELFDFYIEKYETIKYCRVHAPDFDMDILRKEMEEMIVPIFSDKIISLDEINMKLQSVQAFRNRVVEIRLAFLKNYTFRKRALKRLQDNLMKCSKEKSVDKRSGEIAVHLGDLERDFDMVDDFYKCVEIVFDNLNHTQDVISRMITCIQERNKRVERGEEAYEHPVSDTEEFMPKKTPKDISPKESKGPKTMNWDDIAG
ncbi:MAG: hypothetical protein ACXAAM_06395 [Candidatus Heimdallarchaeaceae archaeon]|jgi:hypothetical protein